VARITIQTTTPVTVGTGGGDDTRDSICVADASGLPAIPGSSIAGALRHALAGAGDPDTDAACRRLFGFQEKNRGASSRVEVSWAQVHDTGDRPVPFRGADTRGNALLAFLATGITRDHARVNARGAVDDRGKFDETLVPTGARFTFEIVVVDPDGGELDKLLDLLAAPTFRLGGRTRRGYGRFRLVRVLRRDFDLTRPDDRRVWRELPADLHRKAEGLVEMKELPRGRLPADAALAQVEITPEDHWIVAGGEPVDAFLPDEDGVPDMLPLSEQRIEWPGGKITEHFALLPAASLKGALRHRSAYHCRCREGGFVEAPLAPEQLGTEAQPEPVQRLFGSIRDDDSGRPGRVHLTDLYVAADQRRRAMLEHVSIDRFTGAPVSGALFDEAPHFRGDQALRFDLIVDRRTLEPGDLELLDDALEDLVGGRLAVGGGANRGHGYFQGSRAWKGWERNDRGGQR